MISSFLLIIIIAAIVGVFAFFIWFRHSKYHKIGKEIKNESNDESRSNDMPTRPDGEYYREINWLAIIVFFVIIVMIFSVAFLSPTVIPALFYLMELKASAFLWQRMTVMPLWAFLGILLFAWGPFTLFKPTLVFEGHNYWYYKVRGPDWGLITFYLIRNMGKQPITILTGNLRRKGLTYYVQSNDLVQDVSRKPNLIVIEGLSTGEVRENLELQRQLHESRKNENKLWRELRKIHAPGLETIYQYLEKQRGEGGKRPDEPGKER